MQQATRACSPQRRRACVMLSRSDARCGGGVPCAAGSDECGAQTRSRQVHQSRQAGRRDWTAPWLAAAVALVAMAACLAPASGAVIKGSVGDVGEFMFIDKFCFDTTPLSVAQQVRAGTLPPSHGAIMRFVEFQSDVPLVRAGV